MNATHNIRAEEELEVATLIVFEEVDEEIDGPNYSKRYKDAKVHS